MWNLHPPRPTPIIALITPVPDSLDILSNMFSVMLMETFLPTATVFIRPPPRRSTLSTLSTLSSPLKAVNDGRVTGRYVRKRAVIGDDLPIGRENLRSARSLLSFARSY